MKFRMLKNKHCYTLMGMVLFSVILFGSLVVDTLSTPVRGQSFSSSVLTAESPTVVYTQTIPIVTNDYPWVAPFGTEIYRSLPSNPTEYQRLAELNSDWIRLNARISWRLLQPEEDGPIQWDLLASFEEELRMLRTAGITPIIVVDDYPSWATDNTVRSDGIPTSCGPLTTDGIWYFAAFTQKLVTRYKVPEFNVHHWELGNEPDIDPDLVDVNNMFGCWGDVDDPYYGGGRYGEMLKVVTPAIKQIDPTSTVWFGGLLLNSPYTTTPGHGRPELFLQGVFEVGAAPYFDILAYHVYPPYYGQRIDHDNAIGGPWDEWGGMYIGKARFLRQIMTNYGVDKPLFVNETSLMCPDYYDWCIPPGDNFFQMQADFLVRSLVRSQSENILGIIWFTLDDVGWRYTSLLDSNKAPRPSYDAMHTLQEKLNLTKYLGTVNYGAGIEAYAFGVGSKQVQVLWTIVDESYIVSIPETEYLAAYTRDGVAISPVLNGNLYELNIGFEPVYVIRVR